MLKQRPTWLLAAMTVLVAACTAKPEVSTATPSVIPPPASPSPTAMEATEPALVPSPAATLAGGVEVWLSWDAVELDSLALAVESFRQEYPGVTVSIAYYASDRVRERLQQAIDAGGGPSLLFGPSIWGPDLLRSGLIQEIGDLVSPELHARIRPLAWGQAVHEGAILGLPLELQGVVLFRNTRLVPEPASTIDELLATAQALRQSGQGVGASFDFGFLFSGSQLAVCGGGILDQAGELAFRREIGLCWLDLLYTLGAAGPSTINTDQDLTDFELASSAWLIDTVDRAPRLSRTLGERGLNIDPWPQHGTGGSSLIGYMWTENIYLVADAAQGDFEAAWAFATYLTTPGVQLMLSDPLGAGHLPVVEAVGVESALQAQAIEAISDGLPFPLMNDIEAIMDFLERSVELVVRQGGDPAGALFQAVRAVSRLLDLPLDTP